MNANYPSPWARKPMHRALEIIFDPFGRRKNRVVIYTYLAFFFGRLAIWYWLDGRLKP